MIKYRTGNILTERPPGSYLAHACNAKGKWGAGIAADLSNKYPMSFYEYKAYCKLMGDLGVGTTYISTEKIICLIASNGYGKDKDPPFRILNQMAEAMDAMFERILHKHDILDIHSPRMGSGHFGVRWEETAKLIEHYMAMYDWISWTVWDLP